MSIVLVDMGNSRIKWAIACGGTLGEVHSVVHQGNMPHLLGHPAWQEMKRPRRLLVVSVLGAELNAVLAQWAQQQWQLTAEFLLPQRQGWGVHNAYRAAQQLGADRWAALVAARAMCKGACCIYDCGTALTVDVLAADGRHHGGLIMPGLQLMRDALSGGAAAVPAVDDDETSSVVPWCSVNTRDAVLGGTLYAMVAIIARFARDARATLGDEPLQLLSGGDGARLLPLLQDGFRYEPHLVLQGALIMAGLNS